MIAHAKAADPEADAFIKRHSTAIGRRSRISKVASDDELRTLPLHAKTVPPMHLKALLQSARPQVAKRVTSLLEGLKGSKAQPWRDIQRHFKVPQEHIELLEKAGFATRFNGAGEESATQVLYFCAVENSKGKQRLRPITWPKEFLKRVSTYVSEFSLPSTPEYAELVHEGSHAVAFDAASSFWQVPLDEDVVFLMEDVKGQRWRVNRLPYGVDCASEVMQLIMEEIVHIACNNMPVKPVVKVHIDGCIAVGPEEVVKSFKTTFVQQCRTFGLTLNVEESNEVNTVMPFAGLVLDFATKKVRLQQKFIASLPRVDSVQNYQDLESLVGKLIYGAAALRFPLHSVHRFIKIWRRRLSQLAAGDIAWRDPVTLTRMSSLALTALRDHVARNTWTEVLLPASRFDPSKITTADDMPILVTDATLKSFGACLYEKGHLVEAYGSHFTEEAPSMGVAESAAVLAGLSRFNQRLRGRTFVLLVDNSSTQTAVERGKSQHATMDLATHMIHNLLRSIDAKVVVARVSSFDNVADAPSRGRDIDEACVAASKQAAEQALDLARRTSVGDITATLAGG